MGVSIRGNKTYYYRAVRYGGDYQSVYLGAGAVGELAYREIVVRRQEQQAQRRALQEFLDTVSATVQVAVDVLSTIDLLTRSLVILSGYYQHARGTWRKRKYTMFIAPLVDDSDDGLESLVMHANAGSAEAVARLRKYLDNHPEIWQDTGNRSRKAIETLIEATAGDDILLQESLRRQVEKMRVTLTWVRPTPLEALAIERVLIAWLETEYLREKYPSNLVGQTTQMARYYLRHKNAAERHYNAALKMFLFVHEKVGGRWPLAEPANLDCSVGPDGQFQEDPQ